MHNSNRNLSFAALSCITCGTLSAAFTNYSVPVIDATNLPVSGSLVDNTDWGFGSGTSTSWRVNHGEEKMEANTTQGRAAFGDFYDTSADTYSMEIGFEINYRSDLTGFARYFRGTVSTDGSSTGAGFVFTQFGGQTYGIEYINSVPTTAVTAAVDVGDRLTLTDLYGTATPTNGDLSSRLTIQYTMTKDIANNQWDSTVNLIHNSNIVQTLTIDDTATGDLFTFTDELHPTLIGPNNSKLNFRADLKSLEFAATSTIPEPTTYAGILGLITIGLVSMKRRKTCH